MNTLKTFFDHSKDGFKLALITLLVVILCLSGLYAVEQVDHLALRLEVTENRLEQVEVVQQDQQQLLSARGDIDDMHELRLDQIDSENLYQHYGLVHLFYESQETDSLIRAAHACFLVKDFAEASEDLCTETRDLYRCRAWRIYERACMRVDENGDFVLSPNPAVYHQLMQLYRSMH